MAAARKKRRRNHLPRRRKQATRRKSARRKLLPKQRKQSIKRGKQISKTGGKQSRPPKKGLRHPCDEFVSKVLRRLHRDKVPISTKAKGKMISFIRRFYNRVSDQAKRSKKAKLSCTIGTKELQNALKRVMRKKPAMELVQTIRKVSRHH